MIIVRKSNVHGYGVFAERDIKVSEVILESIFLDFTDKIKGTLVSEYMFGIKGARLVIPLDRVAIINHSDEPNTKWELIEDKIVFTAIKDIKQGEELFHNYGFLKFKDNNVYKNK